MPNYRDAQIRRMAVLEAIKGIDELDVDGITTLLSMGPESRRTLQKDLLALERAGWITSPTGIKTHQRKWFITESGRELKEMPLFLSDSRRVWEERNKPIEEEDRLTQMVHLVEFIKETEQQLKDAKELFRKLAREL